MITEPEPGVVLVELPPSDFGDIPLPEKPHDSLMAGLVVAINKKDEEKYGYLLGRRAHWRKYHDDARINLPDKKLAFIDIVDIKGTSYASA